MSSEDLHHQEPETQGQRDYHPLGQRDYHPLGQHDYHPGHGCPQHLLHQIPLLVNKIT